MSDTYKYGKSKVFQKDACVSEIVNFVVDNLPKEGRRITEKTRIYINVVEGNNYPEVETKSERHNP